MIPLISVQQLPGIFTAFFAGLLSFFSPCVLPLIPVYLSFLAGESTLKTSLEKKRIGFVLIRSLQFTLGFTLVFIAMALVFGGGLRFFGSQIVLNITRFSGFLIIIFGLNIFFDFIPILRQENRVFLQKQNKTNSSALKAIFLGMAFAAGWTPCIGPMLSAILLLSLQSGTFAQSAILLFAYSLGIGIPFIVTALFFDTVTPLITWFKKHMMIVKIVSSVLLVLMGIAMITGTLSTLPILLMKFGFLLEQTAESAPHFIAPILRTLSRWIRFQGL